MSGRPSPREDELRFFATLPRPCPYLEDRSAVSIFADPQTRFSMTLYAQLARYGFRRSGNDLYVPACPDCSECIPVRLSVAQFLPSRSQRRVWRRNRDLDWEMRWPRDCEDLFPLYRDYLRARHPGGGMDEPSVTDYRQFLDSDWSDTRFLVGSLSGRALVVAVTDIMHNALSAVYTFYDTSQPERSPGTLAVLQQIELAKSTHRAWLYLGYWIADSKKMGYKNRFRPLQGYRDGRWREIAAGR